MGVGKVRRYLRLSAGDEGTAKWVRSDFEDSKESWQQHHLFWSMMFNWKKVVVDPSFLYLNRCTVEYLPFPCPMCRWLRQSVGHSMDRGCCSCSRLACAEMVCLTNRQTCVTTFEVLARTSQTKQDPPT